ncbi:MAG: HAMP domain-containing protein [Candidatus Rokubacteria bacterium]|nr:HAMP domain-containing protein [Candidatus Rokubacteria bacterium]MBI2526547.1 HAMP domain-containing protein [Candidatus Rokubacteria bacterium]
MRLGVRQKLVLLSVAVLVAVSFGFTALNFRLARGWIEEDLKERAIAFAREVAATIGDRREFENAELLDAQIRQILTIRQNVTQLDVLAFRADGTHVAAASQPGRRLPFTRTDVAQARQGRAVSRLVEGDGERFWEVMAPITLGGAVAGAVAAKFSLERADQLGSRTRGWTLLLTAASVVVMGLLMSLAVSQVVDRPIRVFLEAISALRGGAPQARIRLQSTDEFGTLARQFNEMLARIGQFNDELQTRVKEATAELDQRYQEVQRLNRLLFDMQRRLGHAERLAVSGRIMAEVAHEVGTPLHSVTGHLELLRQELSPPLVTPEVQRRLAVVETQLARVAAIITQLLDMTRGPRGEPARVDLGQLVRETAELVSPSMAAAGVTLRVTTDPGLPAVCGYGTQLEQVILNLLTNAMDVTPPGGRVEIGTFTGDHKQVVLEVRDTGRGIPAAVQARIFEPFFSTKEAGRGTGLGLFISAQIVREHGGTIDVSSGAAGGTVFRVVVPAGEPAA